MSEKTQLRINASTKNPENSVVSMPYSYRDAKAVLKDIVKARHDSVEGNDEKRKLAGALMKDGEFTGAYFIKNLTDAERSSIEAAAEKDLALGKEGRAAREEALKAERKAAAPAKPEKPQKTEEEIAAAKEARAEANRARAAERDASRVLIEAGSVAIGGTVEKDGASVEVNHIGATFEKDGQEMAYAYFGDLGAEMAAKEAEKEAEAEEPSM